MCRDFSDRPVAPEILDRLLDRARRAPSAGHTQGWAFVVLEGDDTEVFWVHGSDRPRVPPGVRRAPALVVPFVSRAAYLSRYAEVDKSGSAVVEAWGVPYWVVDGAFSTMLLLLGAVEEGLGALFFALRRDPVHLLDALGVPGDWAPLGAVALGWPAPGWRGAAPGSAARGRRSLDEVVHRGGW
jgi:nitroreductase